MVGEGGEIYSSPSPFPPRFKSIGLSKGTKTDKEDFAESGLDAIYCNAFPRTSLTCLAHAHDVKNFSQEHRIRTLLRTPVQLVEKIKTVCSCCTQRYRW